MSPRPAAPEQGVGHRVQQHVGVGVAEQAALVGNVNAADDQPAPRHQRMHVEALPNADIRPPLSVPLKYPLGELQVERIGHLEIAGVRRHQPGLEAERLDGGRLVGHVARALQGAAQHR